MAVLAAVGFYDANKTLASLLIIQSEDMHHHLNPVIKTKQIIVSTLFLTPNNNRSLKRMCNKRTTLTRHGCFSLLYPMSHTE